ncbi:MAG: HAD-IA family hydrolase [Propionibacteriaceae bacterium]|nr:HAD-IA family hydrolase [Propionibacteriaceae bacterium]
MKAVIFDIGGVVLDWVPERAFEQVMAPDQVRAFMDRIGFHDWNRRNDGLATIAGSEADLAARFPEDADSIRAYRRHFPHTITEMIPGTAAVIAELAAAGVRITALTNWAADMFAIGRERFGILQRFADIVVSGEEGIVKPDPEIYELACRRAGVAPGDAVFIDDSPPNVVAATAAGLHGLVFTGADALRSDLVGLGLLAPRRPVTEPVFHLSMRTDWEAAQEAGNYPLSERGTAYEKVGFVHCSFADQVAGSRRKFYGDVADSDLVLLRLDPTADLPLVVENGYPHLFAPLPVDRVVVQESAPA